MHLYRINEEGTPVAMEDVIEWARWFETAERHVAEDLVTTPGGESVRVSTVFLGIDHNHGMYGPPVLWETMIFRKGEGCEQWRHVSRASAKAMHEMIVAALKDGKELCW